MSTSDTAYHQRERLRSVDGRVIELPRLRDVDTIEDAHTVAAQASKSRFAAALASEVHRRSVRFTAWTAAAIAGPAALILVANRLGRLLQANGHKLFVNAPPLTGNIHPRFSARGLIAVAVGVTVLWAAPAIVRRASWRWLCFGAGVIALCWAAALAFSDGTHGFLRSPGAVVDYLASVPLVGSPGAFLHGFVGNIGSYSSHVRAHPPGLVLLLWSIGRIGLSGPAWVAVLELGAGAAAVPAAMITVREMAGEDRARAAAPFLALAPAAVFWSSGDAVFLGVGAWSVALLVLSTGRRGVRSDMLALGGGTLFGLGLFLSYGLVLLAAVPVAVVISRRRPRTLVLAVIPMVAIGLAFAAAGFSWFAGLSATRREYAQSVARLRPYPYFLLANLAALAVAVGPAVWAGLARCRNRELWLLAGAALGAIVVADVSGLSKAEVERIWLPFMPWLTLTTGAALWTAQRQRTWLGAQIVWGLGLQLLVVSAW